MSRSATGLWSQRSARARLAGLFDTYFPSAAAADGDRPRFGGGSPRAARTPPASSGRNERMTMWTGRRLRRSARRDGSQRDPFHHPLLRTVPCPWRCPAPERQRAGALQAAPRQIGASDHAPATWTAVALHRSSRRSPLRIGTVRGPVVALGACETGERLEISLFYALKVVSCIQSGIFFHLKG